jgi:hypothetical protein
MDQNPMIPNPLADDVSPDADRQLVERARNGSRDALEQLLGGVR